MEHPTKRKKSSSGVNNLLWLWLLAFWGGVLLIAAPGSLDVYNPVKATVFVVLAAIFPFFFWYYKKHTHEGFSVVMSPGTIGIVSFLGLLVLSTVFALQKQDALWGYNMSIAEGLVFYFLLVVLTLMFLSFPMRYIGVLVRHTLVILGLVMLVANVVAIGSMLGMFKAWLSTASWWSTHFSFLNNRLFHPAGGVLSGLLFSVASMFIYVRLWFRKDPFSLLIALLGGIAAAVVYVVYAAVVPLNQLSWYVLLPVAGIVMVSIVGIVQAGTARARWFISIMAIVIISMACIGAWASAAGVYKKMGFDQQTSIVNMPLGDSLITMYNQFNQGGSGLGRSLVGAGLGSYQYIYSAYRPDSVTQNNQFTLVFYKASIYPLTLISSVGILGLLAFLFVIGYVGRLAILGINHVSGHLSTITVGWLALFWIIVSLVTFASVPILIMTWLTSGLLIALWFKHHKLSRHLVGLKFQVEDATIRVNTHREGLHIITWIVWPIFVLWLFWQVGTITVAQVYNYRADLRYNNVKAQINNLAPSEYYKRINPVLTLNDAAIKWRFDYAELHHRRAIYLLDQYQMVDQAPETVGAAQSEAELAKIFSSAEKEFNFLTNRDPYDYRYWYTMFLAYRAQAIHTKGAQGVDNAARSIREAIRINQYELNMRVEYANFLLLLTNNDDAINEALRQVTIVLNWNNGFARAYLPLARVFELQKKYDRAIETYTSLLNGTTDQSLKDTLQQKIDELTALQKKAASGETKENGKQ